MSRADALQAAKSAALFVFTVTLFGVLGLDRVEVSVFLLFVLGVSLIHCGVIYQWIFWRELKMLRVESLVFIAIGAALIWCASLNVPVLVNL